GEPFETRLSVAKSAMTAVPRFSGTGTIILQDGGLSATMRIPTSEAMIPAGENRVEKSYRAIIKVPRSDGSETEMPIIGSFTVVRPCVERK
ncbi:MAG: hypothetical protein AAF570_29510, partial [Bacteroidota bacterium]